MSVILNPGNQFIKLMAMTPANFGTQWGDAAVDSPTQTESQWGLPYIPGSALKGVLNWDFMKAGKSNDFFGTEDEWESGKFTSMIAGKPASLIFGDAWILSFPIRFADGSIIRVIPLMTLFFLQEHASDSWDKEVKDVFSYVFQEDEKGKKTVILLGQNSEVLISNIRFYTQDIPLLLLQKILTVISPFRLQRNQNILLAGPKLAFSLWKNAYEPRTQIKMQKTGTTAQKTLRKIQLIPQKSVFISFVSNRSKKEIVLSKRKVSLGAWEKDGMGWFRIDSLYQQSSYPEKTESSPLRKLSCDHINEQDIISESYKSIYEFRGEKKTREKIKSALHHFGTFMGRHGTEEALSFALAKAKPLKKSVNEEMFVHRWILDKILNLGVIAEKKDGIFSILEEKAVLLLVKPPIKKNKKQEIYLRWLWLKKYTEIEFM